LISSAIKAVDLKGKMELKCVMQQDGTKSTYLQRAPIQQAVTLMEETRLFQSGAHVAQWLRPVAYREIKSTASRR
jgi:hypothetical protein